MIVNGKEIKQEIIKNLSMRNLAGKSIGILSVGNNSSALSYLKGINGVAHELSVNVNHVNLDKSSSLESVLDQVLLFNNSVDGILILTPLPDHLDLTVIASSIDDNKDLDCLKDSNVGKFYLNKMNYGPSTARSVLKFLEVNDYDIKAKNVVVIGTSNIVGKPVAKLLLDLEATVTLCNKSTINLRNFTKKADVIVVAAGVVNLLDASMVKEDVIVIDVGINFVDGKMCGDANYQSLLTKSNYITPVPGGVGVITSTLLFDNLAYLLGE